MARALPVTWDRLLCVVRGVWPHALALGLVTAAIATAFSDRATLAALRLNKSDDPTAAGPDVSAFPVAAEPTIEIVETPTVVFGFSRAKRLPLWALLRVAPHALALPSPPPAPASFWQDHLPQAPFRMWSRDAVLPMPLLGAELVRRAGGPSALREAWRLSLCVPATSDLVTCWSQVQANLAQERDRHPWEWIVCGPLLEPKTTLWGTHWKAESLYLIAARSGRTNVWVIQCDGSVRRAKMTEIEQRTGLSFAPLFTSARRGFP